MSTNSRHLKPPESAMSVPSNAATLATIDLSAVQTRFQRDHPAFADMATSIEQQYRRFLHIKLHHSDTDGLLFAAPSPIGAFWRTHALHTACYMTMWQATGVFLHYDPNLDDHSHPSFARRLENTVEQYKVLFGQHPEFVDKSIWGVKGVDKATQAPKVSADQSVVRNVKGVAQDAMVPWGLAVQTLTGKQIRFRFAGDLQAGQLKQIIQDREGIPPDQQLLIFAGKRLEDSGYLRQRYGLPDGATVHLVLGLRGC